MSNKASPCERRRVGRWSSIERGAAAATLESRTGDIDARIELAAGKVADIDRQIAQIDAAVSAATQRGNSKSGLSAVEGQKKARQSLVDEREKAAGSGPLKVERAHVAAQGRRMETEAAPIVYVAELVGAGSDSERAIRWLILCCDPPAIALTAAASAKR
jgi:hypothetical protein